MAMMKNVFVRHSADYAREAPGLLVATEAHNTSCCVEQLIFPEVSGGSASFAGSPIAFLFDMALPVRSKPAESLNLWGLKLITLRLWWPS